MNKIIYFTIALALISTVAVLTNLAHAADLNQAASTLPSNDDWAIMAHAAVGQNTGTSFLATPVPNTPTDIEKRILAITATGGDPSNFAGQNFVAQLTNQFDGNQIGDAGLLNDDIFGILALSSSGISDNVTAGARQYILSHQNPDGGFGFGVGQASDSNTTAMAAAALTLTGGVPRNAFDYLSSTTDSSGGYAYQPGQQADGASTAWVISGLITSHKSVPDYARTFLENMQLPDGTFKWQTNDSQGSALTTAYAVIALSGHGIPVGTINTTPPTPTPTPSPNPSPTPTPPPNPTPTPTPVPIPNPTPTPTVNAGCRVPIYNTDFAFPPEGGQIIQIGDQMYFVRTYLPGCENAILGGPPFPTQTPTPIASPNPTPAPSPTPDLITNSNCLVPIYHQDFSNPEGGTIEKISDQLYFVRTYLPECANMNSVTIKIGQQVPNNSQPMENKIHLKVSFMTTKIFDEDVNISTGATALSILSNLSVETRTTSLGTYVYAIAGHAPSGTNGWQYAVNGTKPNVTASKSEIHNNDTVLWFYGDPNTKPY